MENNMVAQLVGTMKYKVTHMDLEELEMFLEFVRGKHNQLFYMNDKRNSRHWYFLEDKVVFEIDRKKRPTQ